MAKIVAEKLPARARWSCRADAGQGRMAELRPGLQGRDDRRPGPQAEQRRSRQPLPSRASSSTCAAARTCRDTGKLKAFKLLSVAGAYWRGDEKQQDAHPHLRHRLLRREGARRAPGAHGGGQASATTACWASSWGCSCISDAGRPGPGPLDAQGRDRPPRSWRACCGASCSTAATSRSITPHIGKLDLYRTSGHYPYYKDSQFPPIQMAEEQREAQQQEEGYLLKPMNCPHHIQIYKAEPRSYRDLPVRLAEFGTVYRFEQSGELSGMTRVRGFTQDDAHLFCTAEQVEARDRELRRAGQDRAGHAGAERLPRAGRPARPGQRQVRRRRRRTGTGPRTNIRNVVSELGMNYTEEAGEAAFYGPEDRLRRQGLHRPRVAARHRAGGLQPAGAVRPGVHRRGQPAAPAGDDPPGAVRLDGAVHRHPDRALRRGVPAVAGAGAGGGAAGQREVQRVRRARCRQRCRRPACGRSWTTRAEKIGAKIRQATLEKVPYMVIVGPRRGGRDTVAVRHRTGGDAGRGDVASQCRSERAARRKQVSPARPPETCALISADCRTDVDRWT